MMPAQTWTLSSPNSLLRLSSLQAARVLNMPGWLSATHSSSAVCNHPQSLSQHHRRSIVHPKAYIPLNALNL